MRMSQRPRRTSGRSAGAPAQAAKAPRATPPPPGAHGNQGLVKERQVRRAVTGEELAYRRGLRYRAALLAAGRPVLLQGRRTTLKKAVRLLRFSKSDPDSQ